MPFTEEAHLRTCAFAPYRKGMGPTFRLTTWDTGRTGYGGKCIVGYCLAMKQPGAGRGGWVALFEGEDFGCSPLHSIDSDATCAGIMGFLTLRPGDTDDEYFESYTPEQLDYCQQHAESLSSAVLDKFGDL